MEEIKNYKINNELKSKVLCLEYDIIDMKEEIKELNFDKLRIKLLTAIQYINRNDEL